MKRISFKNIIAMAVLTLSTVACENQDQEFDNFDYTASYFPYQFPVRTLVLGEVDYDNTNDRAHKFLISAAMGGVYNNDKNLAVNFEIDETLLARLYFNDGKKATLLPAGYYSLSDESQIIIPANKETGGVTVQLADEFFADPLSYATTYVLPLRITTADTDSVLRGRASVENPDPRIAGNWSVRPKDYTLFAVKYINEYHGNYLLRGKTTITNDVQTATDVVYHAPYVEQDIVTPLDTRGLQKLRYSRPMATTGGASPGSYVAIITVDEQGNCTIAKEDGSAFDVTGTGKYVPKGDAWGGKSRDVFHLDMNITYDNNTYAVKDTLVFRDNTVNFEEFTPKIQ